MGCDCDTHCATSTSCMCVFTHDDGVCECECTGPIVIGATFQAKRRPPTAMIDICVKNIELASLAASLSGFCSTELLIPATLAKKPISVHEKQITIANLAKQIGLRLE
jgi:hypothetical protein